MNIDVSPHIYFNKHCIKKFVVLINLWTFFFNRNFIMLRYTNILAYSRDLHALWDVDLNKTCIICIQELYNKIPLISIIIIPLLMSTFVCPRHVPACRSICHISFFFIHPGGHVSPFIASSKFHYSSV